MRDAARPRRTPDATPPGRPTAGGREHQQDEQAAPSSHPSGRAAPRSRTARSRRSGSRWTARTRRGRPCPRGVRARSPIRVRMSGKVVRPMPTRMAHASAPAWGGEDQPEVADRVAGHHQAHQQPLVVRPSDQRRDQDRQRDAHAGDHPSSSPACGPRSRRRGRARRTSRTRSTPGATAARRTAPSASRGGCGPRRAGRRDPRPPRAGGRAR